MSSLKSCWWRIRDGCISLRLARRGEGNHPTQAQQRRLNGASANVGHRKNPGQPKRRAGRGAPVGTIPVGTIQSDPLLDQAGVYAAGALHLGAVLPKQVQLLQLRLGCVLAGSAGALCRSSRARALAGRADRRRGWRPLRARGRLHLLGRRDAQHSCPGTAKENLCRPRRQLRRAAGRGDHGRMRSRNAHA